MLRCKASVSLFATQSEHTRLDKATSIIGSEISRKFCSSKAWRPKWKPSIEFKHQLLSPYE